MQRVYLRSLLLLKKKKKKSSSVAAGFTDHFRVTIATSQPAGRSGLAEGLAASNVRFQGTGEQ